MITPLSPQILPQINKTAQSVDGSGQRTRSQIPSRQGSEGLAASILADGGLGFLQSRLEEKMDTLLEKADQADPQTPSANKISTFDSSLVSSPEATAGRIVGFALGLKNTFRAQNPDLSEDELMAQFEKEVRQGISEGFAHARGILGDLDLLSGQVEDNVDSTRELVQQKLEEFFLPSDPENGPGN
jgi:Domain of unknown function (DUF5610)